MMIVITVSPIALVKAPTSGTLAFTTSGLAGTAGITCPNSNGNCYNNAAEPAIRADAAGNFYGSSENGLTGGTDAWRSTDGGLHYHTLVSPNSASAASNQLSPAGRHTDLAVDSQTNINGLQNAIGNLAIDPANHYIYQSLSGVATAAETTCTNCGLHAVWLAVSTDGGLTFTDHAVYVNPSTSVSYGHQFVNVSVDRSGNIYVIFTDDHNLYYSFSIDHGTTWSSPTQVNQTPSNTAIFPWSTAGGSGKLDIVWYGTSYYDGKNTPDNYPMSAAWYVYFAQNLQATTNPANFTQLAATPIIHYGGVCESGVSCTGNRDLYDDFGVAASPTTGLASIIYSNDQYVNSSTEPAAPGCTSSTSNTGSCDHTDVATQTSGPGIFP